MPTHDWSAARARPHRRAPPRAPRRSRSRSRDAPPDGVAPFDEPMPDAAARRPHRARACRLRVLDEGRRAHLQHRRRGPRQLQRRQRHPRVQDARRGRRQLRRRRAARVRLGHDGRRPARSRWCASSRARSPTARWPTRPSIPTSCSCASTADSSWCCRDAIPGLRIEGKPQCHIVAIAKEEGVPAASVGCALSRVRTGMPPTEMTCAIPARQLPGIVGVDPAQRGRRRRRREVRRRRRAAASPRPA